MGGWRGGQRGWPFSPLDAGAVRGGGGGEGKGREGVEVGGTEAGCFLRESVEVDGGEWLRLRVAEGKQASVTSLPPTAHRRSIRACVRYTDLWVQGLGLRV